MTGPAPDLLCPECWKRGKLVVAVPSQLPLAPPDPTYRCMHGHGFDTPHEWQDGRSRSVTPETNARKLRW